MPYGVGGGDYVGTAKFQYYADIRKICIWKSERFFEGQKHPEWTKERVCEILCWTVTAYSSETWTIEVALT